MARIGAPAAPRAQEPALAIEVLEPIVADVEDVERSSGANATAPKPSLPVLRMLNCPSPVPGSPQYSTNEPSGLKMANRSFPGVGDPGSAGRIDGDGPPPAMPEIEVANLIGSSAGPVADHRNSAAEGRLSPALAVAVPDVVVGAGAVAQPRWGVRIWPAARPIPSAAAASRAAISMSRNVVPRVRKPLAPVLGDAAVMARARALGSTVTEPHRDSARTRPRVGLRTAPGQASSRSTRSLWRRRARRVRTPDADMPVAAPIWVESSPAA